MGWIRWMDGQGLRMYNRWDGWIDICMCNSFFFNPFQALSGLDKDYSNCFRPAIDHSCMPTKIVSKMIKVSGLNLDLFLSLNFQLQLLFRCVDDGEGE